MDLNRLILESTPSFLALSPQVSYPHRGCAPYDHFIASVSSPVYLCSGYCRDPMTIEPWESLIQIKAPLEAQTQARAYNMHVGYPTVPHELLQELFEETLLPYHIHQRKRWYGNRIVTCELAGTQVVVTTAGARGQLLAVTTVPQHQQQQHSTRAFPCMSCTILQLEIEPQYSDEVSPLKSKSRQFNRVSTSKLSAAKAMQRDAPNCKPQLLAVRHSLGVSIVQLHIQEDKDGSIPQFSRIRKQRTLKLSDIDRKTSPNNKSRSRSSKDSVSEESTYSATPQVTLNRLMMIPLPMSVLHVHWNPFLPGYLLLLTENFSLYGLRIHSTEPACRRSSTAWNHSSPGPASTQSIPQPDQLVHALPSEVLQCRETSGNGASLAVIAHPRRVYVATGASIYIAEVSLVKGKPATDWTHFVDISEGFGVVSSLLDTPWYSISHPALAAVMQRMLFVCTSTHMVAFDTSSPETPKLVTPLPPGVIHGHAICVHAWQTLLRFSPQEHWSASGKSELHCKLESQEQDQEEADKYTVYPRAPVALGCVLGTCKQDGHMFACPFAVAPPLRGLAVRRNEELGPQEMCGADSAPTPGYSNPVTDTKPQNGIFQPANRPGASVKTESGRVDHCSRPSDHSRVECVYLPLSQLKLDEKPPATPVATKASPPQPKPPEVIEISDSEAEEGAPAATPVNHTSNHATPATPVVSRDEKTGEAQDPPSMEPVCVFSGSTATQWIGIPHMFGFPINLHLHADPVILGRVVAAEVDCARKNMELVMKQGSSEGQGPELTHRDFPREVLRDALPLKVRKNAEVAVRPSTLFASISGSKRRGGGVRCVAIRSPKQTGRKLEAQRKHKMRKRLKLLDDDERELNDRGFVDDVAEMLDTVPDSTGMCVWWADRNRRNCSHTQDELEAASCPQVDLVAGLLCLERIFVSGDATVLYEKLVDGLGRLFVARSAYTGSVLYQEFAWKRRDVGQVKPDVPGLPVLVTPSHCRRVKTAPPLLDLAGMPCGVPKDGALITKDDQVLQLAPRSLGGSTLSP